MQAEVLKLLGAKDLEEALKEFDVEGKKMMDKTINKAANTIKIHARTYIKDDTIPGLTRWKDAARYTVRTQSQAAQNVRQFPRYDAAAMKAGLRIKKQRGKYRQGSGFSTAVAIEQMSPAGNIYEKGGIVAGNGTRTNHSLNPYAPYQFKLKLQSFYFISKGRGRALIRAGREDSGKANAAITRAQYQAEVNLQNKFIREMAKNG
jgi:hypothetical protein